MAARTFPSTGLAPIDAYTSTARPLVYFEKTVQTGSVFNNQVATFRTNVAASTTTSGFPCTVVIRHEVGATVTGAIERMLYMYYCSETATVDQDQSFIRMEDNSAAGYGPYAFLELAHGNATTKGPKFLIHSNAALGLCHHNTGVLALVQSGWFRVAFGTTARYIALYSS